jgi:hypothetical protein
LKKRAPKQSIDEKHKGKLEHAKEFKERKYEIKSSMVERNQFLASKSDMRGKKSATEFRGETSKDQPIRWDPMMDVKEAAGDFAYDSGSFRGGQPKKEVNNKYAKRGVSNFEDPAKSIKSYKPNANPNPFPVRIKSAVSIPGKQSDFVN